MNIVLVGGGKVGYYLTKTLLEAGHDISVIDYDETQCRRLAEDFGVLVICGDGTNIYHLSDAGTDSADAVVAVTGSDEENLVVCQLAKKKFQVGRTVARVNNPKNQEVFGQLGVDVAVSSTAVIAQLFEREVTIDSMKTLLTLGHGEAVLVEVHLTEKAAATNLLVRELARVLPAQCVLVSIIRGDRVIFPRGDTLLLSGDAVLALTTSSNRELLREILLDGKNPQGQR